MTTMNNTFLTDLCPSKIAAIIGKKGSNLIQNINNVAKKDYCNAVMDSDAEDIRVITKFWKSDDKVYGYEDEGKGDYGQKGFGYEGEENTFGYRDSEHYTFEETSDIPKSDTKEEIIREMYNSQ